MKTESIENTYYLPQTSLTRDQVQEYRRTYLWHGFFLFVLGCVIPMFIDLYTNPRAALSAHTLGILMGTFLICVGLAFPYIEFSAKWLADWAFWLLVVSSYSGITIQVMAAVFGLIKTFAITGKGYPGGPQWMEISVDITAKVISSFTLVACFIILYGLRRVKLDSSFSKE